jgi:hypothetical protein
VTATLSLDSLELRVIGANWPSNERVTISLSDNENGDNAQQLGRPRANRRGRFTFETTLEQAPAGPVWIVAKSGNIVVIEPVRITTPPQ